MIPTRRPVDARWRLTVAGRAVALVAVAGFLPTLVIGGRVASIPALATAALGVAALTGWRNVRGLELGVQPVLRATADVRTTLATVVRSTGRASHRDLSLRHRTPGERGDATPRGFISELRAGRSRRLDTPHRVGGRGAYAVHRASLESTYPFGLFERRLSFELPVEHLIRPPYGQLRGRLLEDLQALATSVELGRRHGFDEPDGLRPWREGESLRHVHWKASARSSRLVARTLSGDERPPLVLCLAPTIVGRRSVRRSRALEEAVSLTATLLRDARRRDLAVRLVVFGSTPVQLDLDRGRTSVEAALDLLARVAARQVEGPPRLEPPRLRGSGAAWLVTSSPVVAPRFDRVLDTEAKDLDLVFASPFGSEDQVFVG